MPKTTEQLAASRAGETAESNGFGAQERPLRPAGLYELKNDEGEVVDSLIVKTHPKFGDSQAAAVERVGYRFVRPAKEGEVKHIEVDSKALATEGTDAEDSKGVKARLTLLEQENKKKDEQIDQLLAELQKGTADGPTKALAKEEAKSEATARVVARANAGVGTGADETQATEALKNDEGPLSNEDDEDDEEDEGGEKPFSKLNREELETLAEKEGIELPAEADTNAKIREVITKAREEKEGK